MKKKLYLSGKISGDTNYKEKFRNARLALEAAGYEVVDPTNLGMPDDISWKEAMRHDIRELVLCDAVAVLPDWTESKGAFVEARLANGIGMVVQEVKTWIAVSTAEK